MQSLAASGRAAARALAFAALLALGGCGQPPEAEPAGAGTEGAELPDFESLPSTEWIRIYDPNRASNGFTLAFYRRRIPILLNMNGRIVHSWPEARAKTRARLLSDCSLLTMGLGRGIARYSWEGERLWNHHFEGRFPHHDLIQLASGNIMVLTRTEDGAADDIQEISPGGDVVWEWRSLDHLAGDIADGKRRGNDSTHMNSIHELPDNPWHRRGDRRFAPGNILVSVRNLNLVLIIDKTTREIVWRHEAGLDLQHEALMLDDQSARPGHLLIFNNRYASFETDRQSHVLELDPVEGSVTWSYATPGFFSPTAGAQQPLRNGNLMITSSISGRAFEIDRAGRTVWEWTPPFRLNRPARYAPDHCAALRSLGPADGPPVRPPPGYLHVDRDTYRFSRANQRAEVEVAGERRSVLRDADRCSRVVVPQQASIELGYGANRVDLPSGWQAHFSLALRHPGTGAEVVLFEDRISESGEPWREREIGLTELALQEVVLCPRVTESPAGERRSAYWGVPQIRARSAASLDEEDGPRDLTREELEVRTEHLRAMGYVN